MHDSSKSLDFLEHHIENWLDCVKHFVQEPRDYVTDIATPQFARYGLPVRLSGGPDPALPDMSFSSGAIFVSAIVTTVCLLNTNVKVQLFIRAMCSANERHM